MCPEAKSKYPKLASLDITSPECSDPAFEGMASNYLKVFDEVITSVEQTPADASSACQRLNSVGKMHRNKVLNFFGVFWCLKIFEIFWNF